MWYFYFSLPYGDSKNEYCKPFYYVRPDGGELYRIMPETLSVSESGGISYQCEHVLATLIDNVLFGYHVVGNLGVYTADVIRYILDHQLVKNWVLDECDFRNQFEYGWEQESLLSALFSVLSPLSSPMIVTDTTVYPWRLSLKKLVTTGRPEMYVRRRYNMTSYTRGRDPQNIVTRLYPLGYGEGINQLNIKGVNDGVPYIQSPKEITDKYGIIENVSDREYVSNSFHCHVTEDITPIQKQDLEYRFWELSNGGKIQYVKYPIDYNIEAIKTLIRRAMEMGFYEGVNLSLAYCDDCGHQELEMDVCPKCGSRNLTKIDRMNGYLAYSRVHGDTRLSDAKMAEIAERKSM